MKLWLAIGCQCLISALRLDSRAWSRIFFTVLIPLGGWPGLLGWVAWETAPAVIPDSAPQLEGIVGKNLAQRLPADARRLALVSETAFACGMRDDTWSGDVHTAVFLENSEKLAKLPDGAKKTAWTRMNGYFIVNMPLGLLAGQKRKREGTCGALQADADISSADRMTQQWRRKLLLRDR